VILVLVILLGVFVRFYQLDAHFLNGDEEFYIIAAEKFHVGSDYDVRIWNYHAPPVGKYLMSLSLIGTDADYSIPYALPPNLWVWNYVAFESIGDVYPLVRAVSAVFGALFVFLIFLIGREVFSTRAGLWGAASAAIAIDYILLSRVVFVDMFLYAFIASTIYFYVKYRKSKRPIPYLLGLFVSLILMFGSKNAQWLVIIPPLLYVEIVGNRKNVLKTINFLIILGVAWFIHSSFIYPPEISSLADEFFMTGANKNLIEPHLDIFFRSIFSINSYFYLAAFLATIGFYLGALGLWKRRVDWGKIKRHLIYPTPHTFLIFVAIISLLVFSLTSLSQNPKYIGQLSIPFFVLGGFVVERLWKHRAWKGAFLILLLVGAFSAVWYFPSYGEYPSYKASGFFLVPQTVEGQLEILGELGSPGIVTNDMNLLIFYKRAVPIPIKDSPSCNQEFLDALRGSGAIGIFKNVGEVEKGFLCDLVFEYEEETELGKAFGSAKAVKY